jgi:hypothetical protein
MLCQQYAVTQARAGCGARDLHVPGWPACRTLFGFCVHGVQCGGRRRRLFRCAVVGIAASVIGAYYYLRRQDDVLRRSSRRPRRWRTKVEGWLIAIAVFDVIASQLPSHIPVYSAWT